MEISEYMSLPELAVSGCESLLVVLSNKHLARFMDEARDDFALAACLGRIDTVRSLLDAGMQADTLVRDDTQMTMLMVACLHGQANDAELLIERDAVMEAIWHPYGGTALQLASLHGHRSGVSLLLCKKADPHLPDAQGRSALILFRVSW